jgi:hypothetical protein
MFTRAKKVFDSQAVARQANHCPTEMSAMKLRIFHTAVLLIVPTILTAQTPTRDRRATPPEQPAQSSLTLRGIELLARRCPTIQAASARELMGKPMPEPRHKIRDNPPGGTLRFIVRPVVLSNLARHHRPSESNG